MAEATDYRYLSLSRFLHDAGARRPAPGGGAAAAVAGAIGISMARMAANYSTGPKYAAAQAVIAGVLERLGAAEQKLLALMTEDQQAFLDLQAGVPDAASRASRVPLDMMHTCAACLAELPALRMHGNPNLASDVAVAGELLAAALRAAAINVRVNLPSLDESAAAAVNVEVESLLREAHVHLE